MTETLHVQRYRVPLTASLSNSRTTWSHREGLWIELGETGAWQRGRGEVAPLPGYSSESLQDCERFLESLPSETLQPILAARSARELAVQLEKRLLQAPAAARFGLESAAFDRLGHLLARPVWGLLRELTPAIRAKPDSLPSLAIAGIVAGDNTAEVVQHANRLRRQGVSTFKLKVGPDRISPGQLETLRELRARFGESVALRLDANQSLLPENWPETFEQLAPLEIEMLEEPWRWETPTWQIETQLPLALDESLHGVLPVVAAERTTTSLSSFVVLKPMAVGGLLACLQLTEIARASGKPIIVSHTLESHIGWQSCAQLALAVGSQQAQGLWPMEHQRLAANQSIVSGRLCASGKPGLNLPAGKLPAGTFASKTLSTR